MPLKKHIALFCLASLLVGCIRTREAPFVIGIYAVSKNQLADVAAEGFDLVAATPSHEFLDEADKYGVKVAGFGSFLNELNPSQQKSIHQLDRHPALWAWYLVDEPDLHNIPPTRVDVANNRLKQFTSKPTFVVLSSGSAVEKYAHTADYLAVDYYPVPWAPISTFAREMKLARVGAAGKPFYAVLQAFSWEAIPEMIVTDKPLRAPTFEELRCMAYIALAQGARGLLFYSYDEPRWRLKEHPALWTSVERLAVEVREHAPLFQKRIPWWPIKTRHHGEEMFNEIFEARMSLSLFEVTKKSGHLQPGFYFLVINTTADPLEFSFQIPFQLANPDSFNQTDPDWITKFYSAYEVAIIGPLVPTAKPDWLD